MRCAPRCGARALDRRLPVLYEPSVGEFGLGGELLIEPVLFLAGEDADPLDREAEILVLRHQVKVFKRKAGRPRLRRRDLFGGLTHEYYPVAA